MSGGGGMEVEVRVVGGARSCFAALPLHLIHALSRTSVSGDLPPVLALHLRAAATATAARWSLAWSGAASRSSAIEVPPPPPDSRIIPILELYLLLASVMDDCSLYPGQNYPGFCCFSVNLASASRIFDDCDDPVYACIRCYYVNTVQ